MADQKKSEIRYLNAPSIDTKKKKYWLVRKVIGLRVFDDENHVMNRSIMDINGEILVISQFTLFASYKKGNRPKGYEQRVYRLNLIYYGGYMSHDGVVDISDYGLQVADCQPLDEYIDDEQMKKILLELEIMA